MRSPRITRQHRDVHKHNTHTCAGGRDTEAGPRCALKDAPSRKKQHEREQENTFCGCVLRLSRHKTRTFSPPTPTDCSACATPVHNPLPTLVLSRPSPWPHQHRPSCLLPTSTAPHAHSLGDQFTFAPPLNKTLPLQTHSPHTTHTLSPTAMRMCPPAALREPCCVTSHTHAHNEIVQATRCPATVAFQCTRHPAQPRQSTQASLSCEPGFFPVRVLEFQPRFFKRTVANCTDANLLRYSC